jgi:hypothetical protein
MKDEMNLSPNLSPNIYFPLQMKLGGYKNMTDEMSLSSNIYFSLQISRGDIRT